MQDRSLEVRHVGKLLVEFTLKKRQEPGSPVKPVRAALKMESIKTVVGFLGANKAVLELPANENRGARSIAEPS
jgi:hypothetical protein